MIYSNTCFRKYVIVFLNKKQVSIILIYNEINFQVTGPYETKKKQIWITTLYIKNGKKVKLQYLNLYVRLFKQ